MLVIFSGSSGVGKNTVIEELKKRNKKVKGLISCTTRQIREGEIKDVNYHYLTKEEFLEKFNQGELAEMEEIHGNYYGMAFEDLENAIKSNDIIIKDLGVEGTLNVKNVLPKEQVLYIFIDAPREVLRERLTHRGETQIDLRLSRYDYEHEFLSNYDFIVQNIDLKTCVDEVEKIINDSQKDKKKSNEKEK